MSKIHQARAHVLSHFLLCAGTHAVSDATDKFATRRKDHRLHGGTTASKGINSEVHDREFHVNQLATSMQLLESMKRHFPQQTSQVEKRTTETYFHRINSMVMMNELAFEDKPHRSDEPNLRTRESSEIPQSSVPGADTTWNFDVRDGKYAGDRKALQIRKLFRIWTLCDPGLQRSSSRAPSSKRRQGQHPSVDGLPDETLDIARETKLSEGRKLY